MKFKYSRVFSCSVVYNNSSRQRLVDISSYRSSNVLVNTKAEARDQDGVEKDKFDERLVYISNVLVKRTLLARGRDEWNDVELDNGMKHFSTFCFGYETFSEKYIPARGMKHFHKIPLGVTFPAVLGRYKNFLIILFP